MDTIKTMEWFKTNIEPLLEGYEINYRHFDEGDFGSLDQVEFNSKKYGGNVDFWGLGWLGIFIWNYKIEKDEVNILLEPNQEQEKALTNLLLLLQKP